MIQYRFFCKLMFCLGCLSFLYDRIGLRQGKFQSIEVLVKIESFSLRSKEGTCLISIEKIYDIGDK